MPFGKEEEEQMPFLRQVELSKMSGKYSGIVLIRFVIPLILNDEGFLCQMRKWRQVYILMLSIVG